MFILLVAYIDLDEISKKEKILSKKHAPSILEQ